MRLRADALAARGSGAGCCSVPKAAVDSLLVPRPAPLLLLRPRLAGSATVTLQPPPLRGRLAVVTGARRGRKRASSDAADGSMASGTDDDDGDGDDDILKRNARDGGGAMASGGVDDDELDDDVDDDDEEDDGAPPPMIGDDDEDDDDEGGSDAWDAALVEFDTAQDAAAAEEAGAAAATAAAAAAESATAAALRLVRAGGGGSGRIDVRDAPAVAAEAPAQSAAEAAAEQMRFLSLADQDRLAASRAAYTSFAMDGADLLVAEAADGTLDLADCFVFDRAAKAYARPPLELTLGGAGDSASGDSGGSAAAAVGAAHYQCVPWTSEKSGDMCKGVKGEVKLLKMYFVPLASRTPYTLDLSALYCFDAAKRVMARAPVQVKGEPRDPVLRIRVEGAVIEDAARLPTWQEIAQGIEYDWDGAPAPPGAADVPGYGLSLPLPTLRSLVADGAVPELAGVVSGLDVGGGARGAAQGGEVDERVAEMLEERDDVEDMPDVPAVDMV